MNISNYVQQLFSFMMPMNSWIIFRTLSSISVSFWILITRMSPRDWLSLLPSFWLYFSLSLLSIWNRKTSCLLSISIFLRMEHWLWTSPLTMQVSLMLFSLCSNKSSSTSICSIQRTWTSACMLLRRTFLLSQRMNWSVCLFMLFLMKIRTLWRIHWECWYWFHCKTTQTLICLNKTSFVFKRMIHRQTTSILISLQLLLLQSSSTNASVVLHHNLVI